MSVLSWISPHARVLAYRGAEPAIGSRAFLAAGATLIGDVAVGEESSIWFNAVVRGDIHQIRIGNRSNLQDLVAVHVTGGTHPVRIGDGVTVGHSAVIHGCTLEDGCLVGMGAKVLDGATIGAGALVGAGSVVPPGLRIPPNTLAVGAPARVRRELEEEEARRVAEAAVLYVSYAREHARESGFTV